MSRTEPAGLDAQSHPVIIEVRSGTFYCDNCGARWVGTWRGPVDAMVCRWCEAPMSVPVKR